VLCDGLGCDGFIWKYLWQDLGATHHVVHWHYRGHGRSEVPADLGLLTIEALADDLLKLLRDLDVRDVVMVGHSMGVQLLLEAARRDDEGRVAALVPMCGASGRVLDTFKNSDIGRTVFPWIHRLADERSRWFRSAWRTVLGSPLAIPFAKWMETNPALVDVDDIRPYIARLEASDPRVFLAMVAGAQRHSADEALPRLTMPTLVVAAERDTFTPMARSVEMAKAMPRAELFVLPDASHVGPLEWPEFVWLRLRRFLREQLGDDVT
jgi:pimeloyl-ACP methyl ester carboxylesterase